MFFRHNYLSIGWALLILIISGLPGDQFDKAQYAYADKVIHALLFAIWYYMLVVGWIKQRSFVFLREHTHAKAFILCLAYGCCVELLQGSIFIGRSVEALDIIANVIGTLGGMALFYGVYGNESY